MFVLKDAAIAHAKAAERVLGEDAGWINANQELVPIFVNLLFQSVEISIKAFAIEVGLATESELRDGKKTRKGLTWTPTLREPNFSYCQYRTGRQINPDTHPSRPF